MDQIWPPMERANRYVLRFTQLNRQPNRSAYLNDVLVLIEIDARGFTTLIHRNAEKHLSIVPGVDRGQLLVQSIQRICVHHNLSNAQRTGSLACRIDPLQSHVPLVAGM